MASGISSSVWSCSLALVLLAVSHVDGKHVVDFLFEEVFLFGVPSMLITDKAKNENENNTRRVGKAILRENGDREQELNSPHCPFKWEC